ncbi:MAG: hypothetical protein JW751_20570 [Polyangiaceae bacterium]|nr:hypothetical protein [Polyangiaceae bacterium]
MSASTVTDEDEALATGATSVLAAAVADALRRAATPAGPADWPSADADPSGAAPAAEGAEAPTAEALAAEALAAEALAAEALAAEALAAEALATPVDRRGGAGAARAVKPPTAPPVASHTMGTMARDDMGERPGSGMGDFSIT